MAWSFGDSFDLYAAPADMINGYWDSGSTALFSLQPGRFTGSQSIRSLNFGAWLTKSSAVNDAVHHFVLAYQQTAVLTGSTLGLYLELFDGVTAQCSIVFRSDGAILLTSGGPAGATLATYTGAVSAQNTWFAFEFEVVINNTTGSFKARKNGNTVDDFSLGSLNTRPTSTNNYANKLTIGQSASVTNQLVDDLFWQSGPATGNWLGDIRCYARMPSTTASAQFAVSPNPYTITNAVSSSVSDLNTTTRYTPFTPVGGTVGSLVVQVNTGFTGNMKCSIFSDSAGAPAAVLGSATNVVNPVTGANTFTFGTPVPVTRGAQYWFGLAHDATAILSTGGSATGRSQTGTSYAAFPVASPATSGSTGSVSSTVNVTPNSNADYVSETLQDGVTTYVYDSTPGDQDFYAIASIPSTPVAVIATTVRGYLAKSDAGARTAAVQLKSGATTVATPTLNLATTFGWAWRTDPTDPATGAAWTPAAVNNVQIGPKTVA